MFDKDKGEFGFGKFPYHLSHIFTWCASAANCKKWNHACDSCDTEVFLQYHEPNCSPNVTSARVEDGFACDTRANNLPPGKTT